MDPASLVRQLLSERPALEAALRTLLAEPALAPATNELLAALIDQQRLIHHKRTRARASMIPRAGLWPNGMMALNHIPDVLLRILCEIAEVPHVTSATTEWLDKMENRRG